MDESKGRDLLRKYREGNLSEEEKAILESWYIAFSRRKELNAEKKDLEKYLAEMDEEVIAAIRRTPPVTRYWKRWLPAAAVVLLALSVGIYLYIEPVRQNDILSEQSTDEIRPGDHRALLTLGSGEKILLDHAEVGTLAQVGNTTVVKTRDGSIAFNNGTVFSASDEQVVYNTVETPRAGAYHIILPDGTDVWLNAASSIRFPAVFSAGERLVEVKGEAYFEVKKVMHLQNRVPFRVMSGGQTVEVLGTSFNVSCYSDEQEIRTTLIEGSIKVENKTGRQTVILRPGQQSLVSSPEPGIGVREVNTSAVTAWKEGYFRFDGIALTELMKQVERWYDVEVIYEAPPGEYEFVGQIERNSDLSKVLRILEAGGVRFEVEGRSIIIKE